MPFWAYTFLGLFHPRSGPGHTVSTSAALIGPPEFRIEIPLSSPRVEIVRIILFLQQLIQCNERKLAIINFFK